jgi:hypothetical protein
MIKEKLKRKNARIREATMQYDREHPVELAYFNEIARHNAKIGKWRERK